MSYWRKCPECGETNYYEYGFTQAFDCGFKGRNCEDRREARCNAGGKSAKRSPAAVPVDAAAVRLRLALLDAAHVAETIANDMGRAGRDDDYAARCRELARQMRAFAGHTDDTGSFDDVRTDERPAQNRLIEFVRKAKPW